jgi:hypothetical protein
MLKSQSNGRTNLHVDRNLHDETSPRGRLRGPDGVDFCKCWGMDRRSRLPDEDFFSVHIILRNIPFDENLVSYWSDRT